MALTFEGEIFIHLMALISEFFETFYDAIDRPFPDTASSRIGQGYFAKPCEERRDEIVRSASFFEEFLFQISETDA